MYNKSHSKWRTFKVEVGEITEALSDASSGLTYSAFVGSRKQCVADAERLFSPKLGRKRATILNQGISKQCGIGAEQVMNVASLVCNAASSITNS